MDIVTDRPAAVIRGPWPETTAIETPGFEGLSEVPDPELVSFVVPTRNSGRTLRACLTSLRDQADATVEVIVVDNHSTDDTPAIAEELADVFVTRGPERSTQRNEGIARARGAQIVFVDSDMVLEPHVARQVCDRFAEDPDLGGLVLPERAFGEGRWAPARVLEKELCLNDPSVEAARAFRTVEVARIGGYDEGLWGREDWDLPDRLSGAGWGIGRIEAQVWHDEGRVSFRDAFAKKRYYGRGSRSYHRADLGVRPSSSGRAVRIARAAVRRPVTASTLAALKSVEVLGYAAGRLPLP